MKVIRQSNSSNSAEWCFNIPFTNQNKWVDISIENGVYFTLSLREIYNVALHNQKLLGLTDDRTFFEIGFRIPFRVGHNERKIDESIN